MGRGRRWTGRLGASVVVVLALAVATAPATARTIYVGGGNDFTAAFKVEGGEHSVLGLDGIAPCHLTEPREEAGTEPFNIFRAPRSMHIGPHGFPALASLSSEFSSAE